MTTTYETEAKLPNTEILEALAAADRDCVTICLGAHKGGAGTKPASQRLHVALAVLEKQAAGSGMNPAGVTELFEPLRRLAADASFGAGHRDSFAIFRSPRVFEVLRMPGLPLEGAWFEQRFRIAPVLERLALRPEFHLLTLTRRRVHLFHVELDEFVEVPLPPGVLGSLDEFNAFDAPDHTLRNMSSSGGGGKVAFGTGSEKEKEILHFRDFCHALDRGLHATLNRAGSPLLLAGTGPEVAIYRDVCGYGKLVEPAVTLSPDGGWSDAAIVQRAREIAAAWVSPDLTRVLAQFERKNGTGHGLSEAIAIGAAAAGGRVASLIVTEGARMPKENGDFINDAVTDTLRLSGHVWIVPAAAAGELPPLAAILRY